MAALLREACAGVRAVVALDEPCDDLLSGARLDGSAALARFGAAALRRR
jgi:hypothetical protein